ncbi:type II secretion system protein [Prosthecobacter sp.]|uniref:type II secretion system protein n=1 Tax=Prosthecobacter sp. TaxID=1965333 RepID=UPI002AB95935|nr:type II secretion system protein [Prosthecobacter sp.]MDZ4402252.1 type II secretion system protein [Prosthecobacter sp.]
MKLNGRTIVAAKNSITKVLGMQTAPHQGSKSGRSASGFSLVELLMAIMIIGIMFSLAMMAFGGVRQGAVDVRDKRNAQEIAGVAAAALAAGADFIVEGDEKATIENLREGYTPTHGIFKGRIFKAPFMHDPEVKGAMRFLALNDSGLQYRLDGSGSP